MQKALLDYENLILEIQKMKSTNDFNSKTLCRKIRKYCRTSSSKNHLIIQLKAFKNKVPSPSIFVEIQQNLFPFNSLYTARIRQPFSRDIDFFSIDFDNNKELLQKIIKHDLLIKLY